MVLEYGLYDGDPVTKVLLQPLTGNNSFAFDWTLILVSQMLPCVVKKNLLSFSLICFLPGRTHQLRVHCSAIGHPILGDFTYSCGADDAPYRMMLHAHLLHIPLEHQPLLVCAGDPFVPKVDPKWLPQRSLRTVSATVAAILENRRIKEEEKERVRKEEERRRGNRKQNREVETEEQKRLCQAWLSEWSGDL